MFVTIKHHLQLQNNLGFEQIAQLSNIKNYQHYYTYCISEDKLSDRLKTTANTTIAQHLIALHNSIIKPFLNAHPNIDTEYNIFRIPKKTHGYRTICAPNTELKFTQQQILNTLQNLIHVLPHECAHAYIQNRGTLTAMQKHQLSNNDWFLKIDLHKFFDNCKIDFVYQQLTKLYPFAVLKSEETYVTIIKDMLKVCSYKGALPQGAPTSPYLTNLIMVPIDVRLSTLAPTYTRYADDLLFSWQQKPNVNAILNIITNNILNNTPLTINYEKTRLGKKAGRNWNLGLMLNKDNQLTIGHKKKQKFRAAIDQFLYNPQQATPEDKYKLSGIISYYKMIEPNYINYIITKYNTKHNKDILTLLKPTI